MAGKAHAELGQIYSDHHEITGSSPVTFLAEIEAVHPAQLDPLRTPAQPELAKRDGLVEKLDRMPLACRFAYAGRDLSGAQAVQPEPDGENEQGQAGQYGHGWAGVLTLETWHA